jgi:hypothetical protein
MPINNSLLIAAPMLQDAFVDKDGTPMAAGTVTCFHDNSRSILKNWYYQSNSPDSSGNYVYKSLPNPLTLSAAGTITDINGVDTIPFFYPYSVADQNQFDPYYITIVNQENTNQLTRANFPFIAQPSSGFFSNVTIENYIINNVFWRNIGTATLTNVLSQVVCPSQHDGFRIPDIQFAKSAMGNTDTVTFNKFPLQTTPTLTGDPTPEYYLNHTCTSSTAEGETEKGYLFPVSLHLNTVSSLTYTFTIQAQNNGASPGTLQLFFIQDTGTGTTNPPNTQIGSITLSPGWTKYTFSGITPSTAGLALGTGGDDALYIYIQVPLNTACNINFTKPSLYLSAFSPTNNFSTYDQIDAIINSPRTGDIRTSLNSFYYFGWVPMNNGSIGSAMSNATARANQDTWQLFNLIWTLFSPFTNGTSNPLGQMFTSAGSPVAYGGSAISDFNAGNEIVLTTTMGKVLLGTVPPAAMQTTYNTTFSSSNNFGNLAIHTPNNVNFFEGMPIVFKGGSLPSGLATNIVYYVASFSGTNEFLVSTSFVNAIAGVVIAWASDGTGVVISAVLGASEGEYAHTQLLDEIVNHTHDPLAPATNFLTTVASGGADVVAGGTTVSASATTGGVSGFTTQTAFNVTQPGYFMNLFIKL